MIQLTPTEARVLGTLVEKAQTVPAQYPITLNTLVSGCNQKNNRDPITSFSEDDVLDALDGLRAKKLAAEVMLSGSRVSKYRHNARETLAVSTAELVILAELLLRGPQSAGELRARASRMHSLESLDAVQNILDGMMNPAPATDDKPAREPYVRSSPPAPGTRATRFVQLLSPDLHPADHHEADATTRSSSAPAQPPHLEARVTQLEEDLAALRAELRELADRIQ